MNIFPQTHLSERQMRLLLFTDLLELASFLLLEYGTLFCTLLKNKFYLDLFNDSKFKNISANLNSIQVKVMTHGSTVKLVGVFCIIKFGSIELILEFSRWRSWVGFLFYILIPAQPNSINSPFSIIFFVVLYLPVAPLPRKLPPPKFNNFFFFFFFEKQTHTQGREGKGS